MQKVIKPETLIEWIKKGIAWRGVDVRSELEYEKGGLTGFSNFPILTQIERHEVGCAYRQLGQSAAIQLGLKLTSDSKEKRVEEWCDFLLAEAESEHLVTCWRGGLRSEFAVNWLAQRGLSVKKVEGGYQAIRRLLISTLENPPPFWIISGLTGSGKTDMLASLIKHSLDLEDLASHRGSSFGLFPGTHQPTQIWFENWMAERILKLSSPFLVEDESINLGRLLLPRAFKDRMNKAPVIWIEETIEKRAERVYLEYLSKPLQRGLSIDEVQLWLIQSVLKLGKRLGGALCARLCKKIEGAFLFNSKEQHLDWISILLSEYYDKTYLYSFNRNGRPELFRGSFDEAYQYLYQYCPTAARVL